jgi:hypothetical protein
MRTNAVLVAVLTSTWFTGVAQGATINVSDLALFRSFVSTNDVGVGQGDTLQFGANISGGSAGATIQGEFTPTGGTPTFTSIRPCGPLSVNPGFCDTTVPYSTAFKNDTAQVLFTNGTATGTFSLPSAVPIPDATVNFPTNVTISVNSSTGAPTISWTLPPGTNADALRVNIFDKSVRLANGADDIIETNTISPTATSFTPTVALAPGGSYAINFQVIQTRDGGPDVNGNNADVLSRSSAFFDFSPPSAGSPPVIALPTIDEAGVYHFSIGSVGPNSVTFIDPKVAIGYDYAIGAGDPNFASVLLPNVGGGHFDLTYEVSGKDVTDALNAGVQFFFGDGGVSAFEVTGISPSAMIDPGNAGAFVTGLTFVSNGSFTGTMTPITTTAGIPEPSTWAMMLLGFAGLCFASYRTSRHRIEPAA